MNDNIAEIAVAEKQTSSEQLEQDFELGKSLSKLFQKEPLVNNEIRQQLEQAKEKYSQMEDLTEKQKEEFINKARAQFDETVDQVVFNNNESDDEDLPEEFNRLMGVIYRCDIQGTIKRIEDYLNATPGVKPLAESK